MLNTVSSRKMSILIIILGLISVGLIIYGPEKLSVYRMIFCLIIFWLGLIPGVIFLFKEPEEREPIPFMGLVGLFYGIFLPFYILGIVMVIRNKNNFGIFIASIPLAHCAMHVYVTLALERYRSSINFCIVLIALAYLVSQFEKLHKKNNSNFLQNSKKT